MLTRGNTKLGSGVWGWSLPALETCPGASELCSALCYAMRGHYSFESVQRAHKRNWGLAESPEFVHWMVAQIRMQQVQVLRIHVSGDFANLPYIEKWLSIVRRTRRTKFYAYTRSWIDRKLRPGLLTLHGEPNVNLLWSYDRTMPYPNGLPGNICYLSENDQDLPKRPVFLVFRDKPTSVMKKAGGNQVCPVEQGIKRKLPITCTSCRLCFRETPLAVQRSTGRLHSARPVGMLPARGRVQAGKTKPRRAGKALPQPA